MLKTNSIYFFDSVEFEEIIHYYLDSGKNALAKKAIGLGLKQHPNSVMLKLLQAELFIFDDEMDIATKLLKELQAIEPTNEEIYIQQANICSKNDDHIGAIRLLKKALTLCEDEPDVFALIGMEYLYLEDFEAARINFENCLEVDIEDYSSLYNVIYCFDMESKHMESIKYLNKHIDKDPYSEVAWHQLGRQYFIIENYTEALRAFDYAVLIDEFFVGGYLEKAKTLEELKRYEEAIENYKKTIKLDDPTSFVFLRIGTCYELLGKNGLAVQFYKKAVNEDPLLEKGWLSIANLYINDKKYNKALFFIKKAIDIDEYNTLYWRKFAEVNLKLDFFEEAVVAFEKCIKYQDVALEIWLGLCDVLCFLGEYKNAIKVLRKSQVYFSNFAEIEYRLSVLKFILKKSKEAEKHLLNGLRIDFEYHFIIKELFPDIFKIEKVTHLINIFNRTS
ncbi:lipopolysaccharide assembly protein LapB [Lutibacter sp.]|uniref:tetratricopeptide repeat protein n=1 Tax=Lutibacter sp. TaxID=1925666 RepID=UPI0027360E46|nr:tetratricopeptide repeat protein [Lutibacter sp.]MDP3312187.1 tetratricopeptide repeat protein [Lutibacter sp.]